MHEENFMKNQKHLLVAIMFSLFTASSAFAENPVSQTGGTLSKLHQAAARDPKGAICTATVLSACTYGAYKFSQSKILGNGFDWAKKNPGKSLLIGGTGAAVIATAGAFVLMAALIDAPFNL
jgi:hypothetical protein